MCKLEPKKIAKSRSWKSGAFTMSSGPLQHNQRSLAANDCWADSSPLRKSCAAKKNTPNNRWGVRIDRSRSYSSYGIISSDRWSRGRSYGTSHSDRWSRCNSPLRKRGSQIWPTFSQRFTILCWIFAIFMVHEFEAINIPSNLTNKDRLFAE